ncbi:MAG: AEC family transporter [bacterium]|nr:AEC family transporter [bacterium]
MDKNITDILILLLTVIMPMALGYLCRVSGIFGDNASDVLGKFVIRVCVPFLIFKTLYKADIGSLGQFLPAASGLALMTILFSVLAYYTARFAAPGKKTQNAFIFSVFAGNYVFLGWGVVDSFYGAEALTRAVFFTLLAWPVFLSCGFGLIYARSRKHTVNKSKKAFMMMLVGSVWAHITASILAISLNLLKLPVPAVAWNFVEKFAAITIPLILFTIGLSFKLKMPRSRLKVILYASFTRLVLGFAVGLATVTVIGAVFPVDPVTRKVILLESVMPTAAMTVFFTQYIEIDRELHSGVITVSTLLSLATIPGWYILLEYIS